MKMLFVMALIILLCFECRALHHSPNRQRSSLLVTQSASVGGKGPRRRRAPDRRKPNYYWNDIENVRKELVAFWKSLDVTVDDVDRPPIPSEALLNHFERNDLRQVVVKYGGREELSDQLGGADIIPGKWNVAVATNRVVHQLLQNPRFELRPNIPPLSPQQKQNKETTSNGDDERTHKRWSYKNKAERRPYNYWTLALVVQKLYEYLDEVPEKKQRPAVWMPRPTEIREEGRNDLYHAIARFGGADEISGIAGLVPYDEWRYFDGQLDLLKELTKYLDENHEGNHDNFPTATEIKENGYLGLYYSIQRYGGRKFLASRLGMNMTATKGGRGGGVFDNINFGPFSLDFAIALLEFVREDQMKHKAPLTKPPCIRIPTEYQLFQSDRGDLINGIQLYGGYENVARRLGLEYSVKSR